MDQETPRRRRRLSAEDKWQIFIEASAKDAKVADVLRRWRIDSSQLARIRAQVKDGALDQCRPALPREHPARRRKKQPVPATQLGALDLPTKHAQLVTQDQHLDFGLRGDSDHPEGAADDGVEERVGHSGRMLRDHWCRSQSSFCAPHAGLEQGEVRCQKVTSPVRSSVPRRAVSSSVDLACAKPSAS
jgi:transposase-like protein